MIADHTPRTVYFTLRLKTKNIGKEGETGFIRGAYRDFKCHGILHGWGIDTCEGFGSFTVGIVELRWIEEAGKDLVDGGAVHLVHAENIKFTPHYGTPKATDEIGF